jgi:hypothetical protein
MIMSVRVSFTTTANDVAPLPKTDDAATTEDMSLTAVPAHSPNECGERLRSRPMVGKVNTAITLKVKIVVIA